MTAEELHRLLDPKVQELIHRHAGDDPAAFAMKSHDRKDLPVRAIAEQIACRRKALKKLPELSRRSLLYTALSLEQASGQRAAAYKSGLEGMAGKKMMDMSGGLGIDTIFFSRRFDEVVYVERDAVLAKVAAYNFRKLGIGNVSVIQGDSIAVLESCPDDSFDMIYVDPSRREKGRRSVALEAGCPNVVSLQDMLLRKARRFCVKASPAMEAGNLRDKLTSLSMILVLSVDRECKEVLLFCNRKATQARVVIKAACLDGKEETVVESGAENITRRVAGAVGPFMYEPDPAIIKARLTGVLADRYELQFINPAVDYLTSERVVEHFPGRSFKVIAPLLYKPGILKSFLKEQGIDAASILRRDFPLSPEEIRRLFRLKESDVIYLFFTRNAAGQLLCICGRRF